MTDVDQTGTRIPTAVDGGGTGSADGAVRRPPAGRARRRRRLAPRPLVFVLGATVLWAVACGLLLVQAGRDARAGAAAARAAGELRSPDDLLSGRTSVQLEEATMAFSRARQSLVHPVLAPLRVLPVGGRQLRSASALVTAAAEVGRAGVTAVDDVRAAFDGPHRTGPERVALLRRVSAIAGEAGRRLDDLDLGPERALIGVLGEGRAELAAEIVRMRDTLATAEVVGDSMAGLLERPGRYLVLAANNAEMRAGSGMVLSLAEARFGNGTVRMDSFRTVAGSPLAPGTEPPISDPDLAARWAWLSPNLEWRNLATTPRFDATAALAADMWAALGHGRVQGVLAVDPVALQAILAATGPVQVDGRSVGAEDVVELLLHDQYVGITLPSPQTERREWLGDIAAAAVAALEGPDVDLPALAEGLARAARGRHVLAWSPRPEDARGWAAAGMAGQLQADSLALGVLNQSGTKLDWFLDVDADVSMAPTASGTAVTVEVRLVNQVPDGESAYIAGPFPGSGVGPNVYSGLVTLNMPAKAQNLTVDDRPTLAALGPDGPTLVAAVPVVVDQGDTTVVRFRFTLRGASGLLEVEPTARVPAVDWRGPAGRFEDDGHLIPW